VEGLNQEIDKLSKKLDEVVKKCEELFKVVKREQFEKTYDYVSFDYLLITGRLLGRLTSDDILIFTKDDLVDKVLTTASLCYPVLELYVRYSPQNYDRLIVRKVSMYPSVRLGFKYEMYRGGRYSGGSLSYEELCDRVYVAIGVCGSHIVFLYNIGYKIDNFLDLYKHPGLVMGGTTDLASGKFGYRLCRSKILGDVLIPPIVTLLPPHETTSVSMKSFQQYKFARGEKLVLLETEIVGSGTEDDPIRPKIDVLELSQSVESFWSEFDFAGEFTTTVKQGLRKPSPRYVILLGIENEELLMKQVEIAKSKGFFVKVIDRMLSRDEVKEIYEELRRRGHDFTLGVDDLWFFLTGDINILPLAVADFYYGNVIEYNRLNLSEVADVESTLNSWFELLNKSNVSKSIKEKHVEKLKKVVKRG